MADHEISVGGWQEAWVDRTHPLLFKYSIGLTYTLSAISLFLGIRSLVRLRRCRRAIIEDPSSRMAIFTSEDKRMLTTTRRQLKIASLYCFNTLAIWCVDAGIGIAAIWSDVEENPEVYDTNLWLDLAINTVSMLGLFIFVFMVFPMIQLMFARWAFVKYRTNKSNPNGTLAPYLPEARVLSTHLAQLWMMAGFLLMAFWPVFLNSPLRLTIAEAVYGSGLAWSHVSAMLNYRHEEIANIEIKPRMSMQDAVKLYGQHGFILLPQRSKENVLPQYSDEKQALLADNKS